MVACTSTLLVTLLARRLPAELAEYIVHLAAATRVQAAARAMLARHRLAPPSAHGFARCGTDTHGHWVYHATVPTSPSLCDALAAWAPAWRPGAYALELTVTHAEGVTTSFGVERVAVAPASTRWAPGDLAETLRFYLAAVTRFHGPVIDATVSLAAL